MNRIKNKLYIIVTVLVSILYIAVGGKIASSNMPNIEHIYQDDCSTAKVVGIISRQSAAQEIEGMILGDGINIIFAAEITTGPNKGSMVTAVQNCDPNSPFDIREVKTGDHVLLTQNPNITDSKYYMMGEHIRTNTLAVLAVVFFLMLLIFGKLKGFYTLISLVFTCLAVFTVFIPSVISGKNIYFWSITTCVFIISMTLILVNGFNSKSLCAAIGCVTGILASAALYFISDHFMQLTGMVDEDSLHLKFLLDNQTIDLKAIVFAAIIIGAVGAIMDVAVSMAASLHELKESVPNITPAAILRSGMTIGRDMMGTMSNTLILAYIGSSLSVTLLLVAYSSSIMALLNREMIVVEILQALVGSTGMTLTIPLTSLICAIVYCKINDPSTNK